MKSELESHLAHFNPPIAPRGDVPDIIDTCKRIYPAETEVLREHLKEQLAPFLFLYFSERLLGSGKKEESVQLLEWAIESTLDPKTLSDIGYLILRVCGFEDLPYCEADFAPGCYATTAAEGTLSAKAGLVGMQLFDGWPVILDRRTAIDLALRAYMRSWIGYVESYNSGRIDWQDAWRAHFPLDGLRSILMERRDIEGLELLFKDYQTWRTQREWPLAPEEVVESFLELEGYLSSREVKGLLAGRHERSAVVERRDLEALSVLFKDYQAYLQLESPLAPNEVVEIFLELEGYFSSWKVKGFLAGWQESSAVEEADNTYTPRRIVASQEQTHKLLGELFTQNEELRKGTNMLLEAVINAQSEQQSRERKTRLRELLDDIEIKFLDFVRGKLMEKYGEREEGWWVQGVPPNIRKDCASRREEDTKRRELYRYMNLIHLKTILEKNWGGFQTNFGKLNSLYPNQKAFFSDFVRINELRNSVAHPTRNEEISQDDLQFAESFFKTIELFAQ